MGTVSNDILVLILLKLPIIDLLKCRVICKNWHEVIDSKEFFSSQIEESKQILVRHVEMDLEYYTWFAGPSKSIIKIEACPFKTLNEFQCFHVVGSLCGVICLADDLLHSTHTIILWNPSIRKSISVPRPTAVFSTIGLHYAYLGFGFIPEKGFIVIRLAYSEGRDLFEECPPYAELYSVVLGAWKPVCCRGVRYFFGGDSHCFTNGVVHWIAYEKHNDGAFRSSLLLVFNVGEEMFKKMLLPLELSKEKPMVLSVSETHGSLVVANSSFHNGILMNMSVWIKKKYDDFNSWEKIIDVPMDARPFSTVYLSSLRELLGALEGQLVLYDFNTGHTRSLNLGGSEFHICSYNVTLALMHEGFSCESVQDVLSDYYRSSFTGLLSARRRWVRISDVVDEDDKEYERNEVSSARSLNLEFSAWKIGSAREEEIC